MKKLMILIFIILLSGIIFFIWQPDKQNLGNNYYYLPKYEAVDIGYPEGAIIYKSARKYLFSDIKIHGDVISVTYNKDFIIAVQNADSSNVGKKYFIIVKKKDLIYGPYNCEAYRKKREELGIPSKLELEKQ